MNQGARIRSQTLGFPRIGSNREIKKALEAYWKGNIDPEGLERTFRAVQSDRWERQLAAGVDRIGVGDATLYDHVLDWALRLGLVPARFEGLEGLDRYFAMARGLPGVPALELTKWFDTNYHYLVPEVDAGGLSKADFGEYLDTVRRARRVLGDRAVPIVLGPVSLLQLSSLDQPLAEALTGLLPRYVELLEGLQELEVDEVQFHEPVLALSDAGELEPHVRAAYDEFAQAGLAINLVTYFDDLGEGFPWITSLTVAILTLDFTRGDNLALVRAHGWPEAVTLGAGVVDGRNVWRIRPDEALGILGSLQEYAPGLRVGPSSSLQFVPYAAAREVHLPEPLRGVLAFAEEKLDEIVLLARALESRSGSQPQLERVRTAWARFQDFAPGDPALRARVRDLGRSSFERSQPYEVRRTRQLELPPLPTTTIGSFPQTPKIRRLRGRYTRGEIDRQEYEAGIDAWIAYTIGVQDGLGLDVLVHGEFERSDMVEYFAEKLDGFAFTRHGWVQSYGHRYVRPPVLYGDVRRRGPMTVREYRVAQSYTAKPVKGMLTGPITILNWSYPRADIPRREVALQIALALREEIADLEQAGARVIQVDEPALREGLPLKSERWGEYLTWAVDAFRLTTGGAAPGTQIHTHMCYADFGDVYAAIDGLEADVISIENARSSDETLRELADYGYAREVGPGVYDVHSPVVPPVEEIRAKLQSFLRHLDPNQIWVNPDCGLKTRAWDEVRPSLQNIVEAVAALREELPSREGV